MACLIDGEKCVPNIKILDSTQFRQIVCDLDVTFSIKSKQIFLLRMNVIKKGF